MSFCALRAEDIPGLSVSSPILIEAVIKIPLEISDGGFLCWYSFCFGTPLPLPSFGQGDMSSRMKVSNGLYGLELYSRFFQKQRSQRPLDKLGRGRCSGAQPLPGDVSKTMMQ